MIRRTHPVKAPTLESIEKRIWQLTLLMTLVILYLTLLLVLLQISGFMGLSESVELPEDTFKYAVSLSVLVLLFCSYVILYHRRLFTLSRAFLEEQDRTRSLTQSLLTVKSLLRVSSSINVKKDLSSILGLIAGETMEAFEADSASIMLLDPKTRSLRTMASCGPGSGHPGDARMGIGESVAGWVLSNGKPMLLNGQISSNDAGCPERTTEPASSCLCVPLESGSGTIGIMNVTRSRGGPPFIEDDLELLTVFANNAAIAIYNARLYAKLKEFSAHLEKKVLHRTRDLEIANRVKSDFLAGISHEFRTPLNAVIGFSDVLLKETFGPLNEEQREYTREILQGGNRLLELVNAVLDFSAIEAGRMDLEASPVRIAPVIERVSAELHRVAASRGLRLETRVDPGLEHVRLKANEKALEQVVRHLLSNAVKFTPRGGAVQVEAEPVADFRARISDRIALGLLPPGDSDRSRGPAGRRGVEVTVADTGPGIESDHLMRVFEPFFQAGEGLGGKRPGTGLGLAIAGRLVAMLGGRIWVESDGKAQGSRFAFLLPVEREESEDRSHQVESSGKDRESGHRRPGDNKSVPHAPGGP